MVLFTFDRTYEDRSFGLELEDAEDLIFRPRTTSWRPRKMKWMTRTEMEDTKVNLPLLSNSTY